MLLKDAFPMLTHGNRLSLRNIFSCTYIALRELITPRFLSTAAPIGAQRRHRSFSNRGHESVPCLAIEPHSEHRIRNMIVSPCGWRHDHGKPLGVRKLCYAGLADSHAWHGDTASLQHNWVRNIFGPFTGYAWRRQAHEERAPLGAACVADCPVSALPASAGQIAAADIFGPCA